MIDRDLKPLPPDLEVLLDSERRPRAPEPQVHSRVRSRLVITLGLTGLGSSAAAGVAPTSAPAAFASSAAPSLGSTALFKLGASVLGALALATGAFLALRPPVPPPQTSSSVEPLPRPLPKELPQAPPSIETHPEGELGTRSSIKLPSGTSYHHPPSQGHNALAAERALLDRARTALIQGDTSQTLKLTVHHAHQFPYGQLAEERDSLTIRALVQKGELDAARAQAIRFRALYPQSIFLPAFDAALNPSP
jgi:hypothetical protein